jgi:large subunit ribosomal protein L17
MKHQRSGRELGRDRDQRKALFRTMLGSLVMREKITTTEAKAKELKDKIDPVINKAKKIQGKDKISAIRNLKILIPEMAVKKLSGEFIDKFKERNSGYARVIKLGERKSDGARLAVIEFV